jgi:hypothetical protein
MLLEVKIKCVSSFIGVQYSERERDRVIAGSGLQIAGKKAIDAAGSSSSESSSDSSSES